MFSADTKVITDNGILSLQDLNGKTISLKSRNNTYKLGNVSYGGIHPAYVITVSLKSKQTVSIVTTEDQRFFGKQSGKSWEEYTAKDLFDRKDKRIQLSVSAPHFASELIPSQLGILHGLYTAVIKDTGQTIFKADELPYVVKYFAKIMCNKIDDEINYRDLLIVKDAPEFFKHPPKVSEPIEYIYGWLVGFFTMNILTTPTRTGIRVWQERIVPEVLDVFSLFNIYSYEQQYVNRRTVLWVLESTMPYKFSLDKQERLIKSEALTWKIVDVNKIPPISVYNVNINGQYLLDNYIVTYIL